MAIEIRPLQFDHLIVYETAQKKADWLDGYTYMEDFTLNQDIYKNGPVFFSFKQVGDDPDKGLFKYYLPINGEVRLQEHAAFSYLDKFTIGNALVLRQADQETLNSTKIFISSTAQKNLQSLRLMLRQRLEAAGHMPLLFEEDFGLWNDDLLEDCLEKVRESPGLYIIHIG
ncbi:DUF4062 domain-containing protein [Bacillaceae bacterium Marseille-Q3522]|nr:DUF4062 domain-containing protein [Bacillaceae bacterium Marseille-Q3522]